MSEPRWVRFDSLSWRGPGRWVRCASLTLTGILIGAACAQSPGEDGLPTEAAVLQSLGVDPETPVDGVAGLWDEVLGSLAETLQVVVMAPHVRARGLCITPGSASEALASLAVQCDGVWVGVQGMLCLRTTDAYGPAMTYQWERVGRSVGLGLHAEARIAAVLGSDPSLLKGAMGESGLMVSDLPEDTRDRVMRAMTRLNPGLGRMLAPWHSMRVRVGLSPSLLLLTSSGSALCAPVHLRDIAAGNPRLELQPEAWARASGAAEDATEPPPPVRDDASRALEPGAGLLSLAELIGAADVHAGGADRVSVSEDAGAHEVFVARPAAVTVPLDDLASAVVTCCPWLEVRRLEEVRHLGVSAEGVWAIWLVMWHRYGDDRELLPICRSFYSQPDPALPPSPFDLETSIACRPVAYADLSPEQRDYLDSTFESAEGWDAIDRADLFVLLLPSLSMILTQGEAGNEEYARLGTGVMPISFWDGVPLSVLSGD
ncbi:MAG: hypothetical protein GX134_06830 [candidate division WS1 bacterium]|nr:hypothetical protein [candidate division WS1 bacterium]